MIFVFEIKKWVLIQYVMLNNLVHTDTCPLSTVELFEIGNILLVIKRVANDMQTRLSFLYQRYDSTNC